jgi:hypothetical protein
MFSKGKQFPFSRTGQDAGDMSHSVDIQGTGHLKDRNQTSFLERTDEKFSPEKTKEGDALTVRKIFASQTIPNLLSD